MDAEQQYIKGFNSGYLLAEHAPDLVQKLVPTLQPVNDYADGLLAGNEQFNLDKERIQLGELAQLRNKSQDKNRELE